MSMAAKVPVKPERKATIKLDKRPEYLVDLTLHEETVNGLNVDDIIERYGSQNDVNAPKFRIDSIYDVRIFYFIILRFRLYRIHLILKRLKKFFI